MKVGDLVSYYDDGVGPFGVVVELVPYYDELLGRNFPGAKILMGGRVLLYPVSDLWVLYENR